MWIGAGVTALLFTIGKFLIGLYIGKSGVASGFGAAGSLVVLLVWVYYSAQIFLIGAEFTWVYARMIGSRQGAGEAAAPHEVKRRRPRWHTAPRSDRGHARGSAGARRAPMPTPRSRRRGPRAAPRRRRRRRWPTTARRRRAPALAFALFARYAA